MKKYEIAKKLSNMLISGLNVVRPSAGTSLPGRFMMKLCPDYINIQAQKVSDKKIFVTGTNGKTTSSGILASILEQTQKQVLHNRQGANMPQGIATCFLKNDEKPVDYCVFESDEAWLYRLSRNMQADYLLVTNLFDDQVERYGGVMALADRIRQAIDLNPDLKLILNADDPHLLSLKTKNTVFFGVNKIENNKEEYKVVPEICLCGEEYTYKKRFYAHIGHFSCKNCKIKRQKPKYKANIILNDDNTQISINDVLEFTSKLTGIYNAYNVLGAVSTALEMGIEPNIIQKGLDNYKSIFGRMDKFCVGDKNLFIQLIKNPVGANQAIKLIKDNHKSVLFVLMNDTPADGKDISWLYDTDFEYFKDYPNKIYLSGTRALELALRFKHAGINEKMLYIDDDIKSAYNNALKSTKDYETLLILANFSALAQLQKIIKR